MNVFRFDNKNLADIAYNSIMEKLYNINATGALYTNREVVCLDLTGHELTYYEGNKTIKFIHKSYGSFMYLDITIDEISRSESECINIKE